MYNQKYQFWKCVGVSPNTRIAKARDFEKLSQNIWFLLTLRRSAKKNVDDVAHSLLLFYSMYVNCEGCFIDHDCYYHKRVHKIQKTCRS